MNDKVTMKIDEETHKKLKSIGRKGESFSEIIDRLLDGEGGNQ